MNKSLSPMGKTLINELIKRGKRIVTIKEAQKISGNSYANTARLLNRLVQGQFLAQLKSGQYLIFEFGFKEPQLHNWPVIARELVYPRPYFISHYSALRLHGLTTHALHDVYVTISTRFQDKTVGPIRYHFPYCKKSAFWGHEEKWVTKDEKVVLSDLERTLLDGYDRPDLCGGVLEVARGVFIKEKSINPKKNEDICSTVSKPGRFKKAGVHS